MAENDLQYTLSNGQVKRLMLDNERLFIAVPDLCDEDADVVEYAKSVFSDSNSMLIAGAERRVLWTALTRNPNPTNLSELLGEIVEGCGEKLAIKVCAIVVEFAPPSPARSTERIQWPKMVVSGGIRWPRSAN